MKSRASHILGILSRGPLAIMCGYFAFRAGTGALEQGGPTAWLAVLACLLAIPVFLARFESGWLGIAQPVAFAAIGSFAIGSLWSSQLRWFQLLDAAVVGLFWLKLLFERSVHIPSTSASRSLLSQTDAQPASMQQDEFSWVWPSERVLQMPGMESVRDDLAPMLRHFQSYKDRGPIADRNGILLYGPTGTGKTRMAHAIAAELNLPMLKVGVQDLTSKWINESPALIGRLFRQASTRPCVVFLDELDAVAVDRSEQNAHSEDRKLAMALLTAIDTARKTSHIVLVAATNHLDRIDSAIVRDGRFDWRLEIPLPDEPSRKAMLRQMLMTANMTAAPGAVDAVAATWQRRSPAWMQSVVHRLRDDGVGTVHRPVGLVDFKSAAKIVSRRASALPKADTKLSGLVLPQSVRERAESIVYRLSNLETIAERGGQAPSGVLLEGPPGTGKNMLVRAIAGELGDWHVFEADTPEILKDPGKFRDLVAMAETHRPAFVFLDEADELLGLRDGSYRASATNAILKEMDGAIGRVPEVVFIAATNNLDAIDPAALRGGRFNEVIHMPRLSGHELITFVGHAMKGMPAVLFAPEVTPEAVSRLWQSAAPADVLSTLRGGVNATLTHAQGNRAVTLMDLQSALPRLG